MATSSMPANWPKPMMVLSVTPVAKLRSPNTLRSRMGSPAAISRIRKAAMAATAMRASATIVDDANQSSRSPRSRKSWRHPKPTTMNARPHQSIFSERLRYGGSNRKAPAMMKPMMPTGRLM